MSKPVYNLFSKKYTLNYLISHFSSVTSSKSETFVSFANKVAPRKGTSAKEFIAIAKWLGFSTKYLIGQLSALSGSDVKKFVISALKTRKKNGNV